MSFEKSNKEDLFAKGFLAEGPSYGREVRLSLV